MNEHPNNLRPKVLITATRYRERCPEGWSLLQRAGLDVLETPFDRPLLHAEIERLMVGVRGAIVGTDPWDARAFASCPDLQVIARFGVGLDNIDLGEAARRSILVENVPSGNAGSVAEFTVLMMLSQLRDMVRSAQATQRGEWDRPVGRDLHGETVGLVGYGDIGRRVANILTGFGTRVIATDPFADAAAAAADGVELVERDHLLARATIVSLHLPATRETNLMVNEEFLERMRSDAVLINTARGALVDSEALADAIVRRVIAGAAVDVFDQEPVAPSHPLLRVPAITATPHLASETVDTYRRIGIATANIMIDALRPSNKTGPSIAATSGVNPA